MFGKRYRYVGPPEIRASVKREDHCVLVDRAEAVIGWVAARLPRGKTAGMVPATFVVDVDQQLWIADRRSEHVACADGGEVLAAGEIVFERSGKEISVSEVSNQSTGYCPAPESWEVVAVVLDRLSIERPAGYTAEFEFRRCESCQSINVIKDDVFECDVCGSGLARTWNF